MIRILFIIPFEDMRHTVESAFLEIQQKLPKGNVPPNKLSILEASTTKEISTQELKADVIIARGAMAYDLQRNSSQIPVIELRLSGNDFIAAFQTLKNRFPSLPAAIIGSPNMLLGIEALANQLGVDVRPYYLSENTDENIYRIVLKALDDGKKLILGGQRGCCYAKTLGAESMVISSTKPSIRDALHMAMQIGLDSQRNRQELVRTHAMLDYAFEGLISIDVHNKITDFNSAAQQILGVTPGNWWQGIPIWEAVRSPRINAIVKSQKDYVDEIVPNNKSYIAIKKVSTYLNGESAGCVLTMLNASMIQQTEGKLRQTLYEKGYVAKNRFSDILGSSHAIQKTIENATAYAQAESNIIIYGETGAGKEIFAQSIHNASPRAAEPFVAINCAAIPESLLESELFGYVGGAFTGALKDGKMGLFEQAHNGTLFLDEIGELPMGLQSRLLRVLQEGEIMRIGDTKVIPVNVRIIAATNRNLEQEVENNKFRSDLFYRLNVLVLHLPSLRERGEDILVFLEFFLTQYALRLHREPIILTEDAKKAVLHAPWKGNIREIQNFCERLAVLAPRGEVDTAFVESMLFHRHQTSILLSKQAEKVAKPELNDAAVAEALERFSGNKTKAAAALGVSRVTLWRYLKK